LTTTRSVAALPDRDPAGRASRRAAHRRSGAQAEGGGIHDALASLGALFTMGDISAPKALYAALKHDGNLARDLLHLGNAEPKPAIRSGMHSSSSDGDGGP